MNRTHLILLLTLPWSANAQQVVEHCDQRTDVVTMTRIIPIAGGLWLTAGWTNLEGGIQGLPHQFLAARNDEGDILWEHASSWAVGGSWWPQGDLVTLPDSGALAVAAMNYCDVWNETCALLRLFPNGDTAFMTSFQTYSAQELLLARAPSDLYAVGATDSVLIFDTFGDPLGAWPAPTTVRSLLWAQDSTLLIAGDDLLARTTAQGALLGSAPIPDPSVDMDIVDGVIYLLTSDSVLRFDPQLNPLAPTGLSNHTLDARAFLRVDSSLWVRTPDAFLTLTDSGTVEFAFDAELLPGQPMLLDAAYRSGTLATTSIVGQHQRSAGLFRTYAIDGAHAQHDTDVEVFFEVDSTWTWLSPFVLSDSIFHHRANLLVHLVNHGTDTVNKVLLSHRPVVAYGYCGPPGQSLIVPDLLLAPGDTTSVLFNNVTYWYGPGNTGDTHSWPSCVVAESPNDHVDRYPSDNVHCDSVLFTVVPVGMREQRPSHPIEVHPNPFNDELVVCQPPGSRGGSEVSFHNVMGQHVRTVFVPGPRSVIDTSQLPPGIYIVTVAREGAAWHQRMIKTAGGVR